MNYYITNTEDLAMEIRARQENRIELEQRIDNWVHSEWGIPNFSDLISKFIPQRENETFGALCRQVATIRVEEISFYLTCKSLGLQPMNITYVDDSFSSKNRDKVHLIKLPWIVGHSKNGQPIVKYEKIVQSPNSNKPLSSISIDGNGTNLPRYHQNLRKIAFGKDYPTEIDIGKIFKSYLLSALNKPSYVYENKGGQEIKMTVDKAFLSGARPPAEWYYPLYLLSFMTGQTVLFETYDNPEGEVGKMKKHFEQTMDMIRDGIGIYPLVAEIPPLKLPMMYINQAVLVDGWQSNILEPPQNGGKIINIFDNFASQIIALKKNN